MIRWTRLLLLVTGMAACTADDHAPSGALQSETANNDAGTETAEVSGLAAYEMACASCHESGADGAPLTGDAAAWAERSPMWQAVLANHASSGYMDMPAGGGTPELSDAVIARAVDYMLSVTYPELPPD